MAGHLDFKLTKQQQAFAAEHVRLACHEAHRFSRRTGIAYEDLVGAAHIGLAKGAHRFDPGLGYKPSTYLVSLIRGELLHYCRDKTYLLRISHRVRELWLQGRGFIPLGHSDQQIADALQVELAVWLECRQVCSGPPVPLNEAVHEIASPGAHGRPQLIEDDRTGGYLAAVRQAWDANPHDASTLFWSIRGSLGAIEQRQRALVRVLEAAALAIDDVALPKAEPQTAEPHKAEAQKTEPLKHRRVSAVEGDASEPAPAVGMAVAEADLGSGRVQMTLPF